jgi:anti-sigma B factor antagonist
VPGVTHQPADEPIGITVDEPTPGTAVLRVGGEVDMLSSPRLRKTVAAALEPGLRHLVIELDGVDFLGTSGLAALVEARSSAQECGCRLTLACSTRTVLRPLQIAGLLELFAVTGSVDEALTATPTEG